MIKEVEGDFLLESIKSSEKPIFVDFYAKWCGPCKMANPILEKISEKYGSDVEFYKIDVDKNREVSWDFGVRNIPFFMFIEGGEITRKGVGSPDPEKIEKFILGQE
jgi:thioredoxin 1